MAFFCETFNRPTDATLTVGFDETWFPASGHFQIVGQRSTYHVCNWPNQAYRVADLDTEDMTGAITINTLDPVPQFGQSYNLNYVAVCLRVVQFTPPNQTYYMVRYGWVFPSGYFVQIVKFDNGVVSGLAGASRAFSPGDRLTGRVEGNVIQAFVNGVEVLSATDPSPITGSKTIGLEYFSDCASPFGSVVCDNYFGGDTFDEDEQCPPVPPPQPSEEVTVTLACGPAFTPPPCPTGCGRSMFTGINPAALVVADLELTFPSVLLPFSLVVATPALVSRPDNCGHAFANDLTPTGDCD